jgi:hypothetical protein
MTNLEIRIEGTQKKIEKLEAKITRANKSIEKKRAWIFKELNQIVIKKDFEIRWLEGDIETLLDDIRRAEKDLKNEHEKLNQYKLKNKAEKDRLANIPNVPSVEAFLQDWKVKMIDYYMKKTADFEKFYETVKDMKYNERQKEIKRNFSADIVIYANISEGRRLAIITEDMEKDIILKRLDLYHRCSEAVGVITDASGLTTGYNGSINGIVHGENGSARVETIEAGGYNIQCYHYRVLVNKI